MPKKICEKCSRGKAHRHDVHQKVLHHIAKVLPDDTDRVDLPVTRMFEDYERMVHYCERCQGADEGHRQRALKHMDKVLSAKKV